MSNVLQIECHKTTGKISATGLAGCEAIATTTAGLLLNCVILIKCSSQQCYYLFISFLFDINIP